MLYDSMPNDPWMKRFLSLSGGEGSDDQPEFWQYSEAGLITLANSDLCCDTMLIAKTDVSATSSVKGALIRSQINEGIIFTNYFGHGSAQSFDMDGWQDAWLNNYSKYGFMATFACNTGAFDMPSGLCRNEEYILDSVGGFIGAMGSTAAGYMGPDDEYYNLMLNVFLDSRLILPASVRL